jgi:Lipocalin-like domain
MERSVHFILVAMLALACRSSAQTDQASSLRRQFVGTWKLVSYVGEELSSGTKSDVMGPHPSGYINYGLDGRMVVIIVGSDRKKPAGAVATPEEAQALLQSMLAYAGTYTIDAEAKTITHQIDVSWDQTRTGEAHVRTYKLEGNRLTLTTQPSRDQASGKTSVRTVTWERLK